MASVVIAAHNEAFVIGQCLEAVRGSGPEDLEIVVVPNGCTDSTADVARASGALVEELSDPGKAAALNVGDALAKTFPRIYLDADIVVPAGGLTALIAVFDQPSPPLAAVPQRYLEVADRPILVRAYFAIQARLPAFRQGLFGRGMIALSSAGRSRFDRFPPLIADDLFLDALFTASEKRVVDDVRVPVETPRSTRNLVRRLIRVRRGNASMRHAARMGTAPATVRRADRWSWLRDVVLPRPWLLPAGVAYFAITTYAAVIARLRPDQQAWGHDDSTRGSSPSKGVASDQR